MFQYADIESQFERYFNRLTKSYSQFDSALAELRVACHLDSKGLPISSWEPVPSSGNAGEYLIQCSSGEQVFVEVKSPGWEGELGLAELDSGRARQAKYIDGDSRWVDPAKRIQFAIEKAYKKFDPASPNLLVIAGDLFVAPESAPELFVQGALYDGGNGYFANSTYQNLGGVALFRVDSDTSLIRNELRLFVNPRFLPETKLPEGVVGLASEGA